MVGWGDGGDDVVDFHNVVKCVAQVAGWRIRQAYCAGNGHARIEFDKEGGGGINVLWKYLGLRRIFGSEAQSGVK